MLQYTHTWTFYNIFPTETSTFGLFFWQEDVVLAIAGVICEYNPFHLGHAKQFRQIRERLGEDAAIICLMSGRYVQRGEPAVFDPSVRAAAAVDCGASLVLELPVTYALRSAEGFAQGGVEILSALGVTEYLAFGCESGDGEALLRTARQMTEPTYTEFLREALDEGLSYAAAREQALSNFGGNGNLLQKPNDILALEYCKAILEQKSLLKPLALQRGGDYHAEFADAEDPSATSIRALLPDGNWQPFVPQEAISHYASAELHTPLAGERAMLARLRGLTDDDWQTVPFGSEGLWSKVMKAARAEASLEGIITASKSRRYPRTRLQRLLLCAYLGIDCETLAKPAPYVRALAFDDAGRALLRQIHERCSLPVIHAGQTPPDEAYAALEARCERLYTLFSTEKTLASTAKAENGRIYYKKM